MTPLESATFAISEDQRRTVRAMAGFGMPVADIAAYLETDAATLRRHMGVELDRAALEANAKVAQALFTMATQQHNVAAAIFWMKARAGWREKHEVKLSTMDSNDLSDEDLMRVIGTWKDETQASIGALRAEEARPAEAIAPPAFLRSRRDG